MTVPGTITKTNLDQATDDPKEARAELATAVDTINSLIGHLNNSTILSTPLTIGSHLYNNGGTLAVREASITQKGVAELATDAEAIAKSDPNRVLTPKNLAALSASTTNAGLIEIADNTESLNGTDPSRAVTPAGLKHVLDNFGDKDVQVFTSNGTWTKPAGISKVRVWLVGGGGSGASFGGNCGNRSGGAGGGFAEAIIDVSAVSSVSVTVGSGGDADVDVACVLGNDGGDSSFGSYVTAQGGQGGQLTTAEGGGVTHSSGSEVIAVTGRKGQDVTADSNQSGHLLRKGGASGWNPDDLWATDGNYGVFVWRVDGTDGIYVGSGGTQGHEYYHHARTTGAGADGIAIVQPIG